MHFQIKILEMHNVFSRSNKNWVVVKYILKYFRILKDYVIVYSDKDLILIGYTNSDFEKCYKVYIEISIHYK